MCTGGRGQQCRADGGSLIEEASGCLSSATRVVCLANSSVPVSTFRLLGSLQLHTAEGRSLINFRVYRTETK